MNSSLTVLILVFILFNSSFFLYFSLWIFTFIPSSLFFCTHKPECVFHTDLLQLLPFSCLFLLSLSFISIFTCYVLVLFRAVRRAVSSTPRGRKVCKPPATICLSLSHVFSLHYSPSLFNPFLFLHPSRCIDLFLPFII